MEPTRELVDEIYAEKVRRARGMSVEEKLLAGPELFGFACEAMRAGIRAEYPDAGAEEVERIVGERLELARRLEDATHG